MISVCFFVFSEYCIFILENIKHENDSCLQGKSTLRPTFFYFLFYGTDRPYFLEKWNKNKRDDLKFYFYFQDLSYIFELYKNKIMFTINTESYKTVWFFKHNSRLLSNDINKWKYKCWHTEMSRLRIGIWVDNL